MVNFHSNQAQQRIPIAQRTPGGPGFTPRPPVMPQSGHSTADFQRVPIAQRTPGGPAFTPRPPATPPAAGPGASATQQAQSNQPMPSNQVNYASGQPNGQSFGQVINQATGQPNGQDGQSSGQNGQSFGQAFGQTLGQDGPSGQDGQSFSEKPGQFGQPGQSFGGGQMGRWFNNYYNQNPGQFGIDSQRAGQGMMQYDPTSSPQYQSPSRSPSLYNNMVPQSGSSTPQGLLSQPPMGQNIFNPGNYK